MKTRFTLFRMAALVLLLTFAFVASGFAHRVASPEDVEKAQYAQTFGLDVADICGGDAGDVDHGCDACRLVSGMALPPPDVSLIALERQTYQSRIRPALRRAESLRVRATRPVRAPPVLS